MTKEAPKPEAKKEAPKPEDEEELKSRATRPATTSSAPPSTGPAATGPLAAATASVKPRQSGFAGAAQVLLCLAVVAMAATVAKHPALVAELGGAGGGRPADGQPAGGDRALSATNDALLEALEKQTKTKTTFDTIEAERVKRKQDTATAGQVKEELEKGECTDKCSDPAKKMLCPKDVPSTPGRAEQQTQAQDTHAQVTWGGSTSANASGERQRLAAKEEEVVRLQTVENIAAEAGSQRKRLPKEEASRQQAEEEAAPKAAREEAERQRYGCVCVCVCVCVHRFVCEGSPPNTTNTEFAHVVTADMPARDSGRALCIPLTETGASRGSAPGIENIIYNDNIFDIYDRL